MCIIEQTQNVVPDEVSLKTTNDIGNDKGNLLSINLHVFQGSTSSY
jgi:hypothetical protein